MLLPNSPVLSSLKFGPMRLPLRVPNEGFQIFPTLP